MAHNNTQRSLSEMPDVDEQIIEDKPWAKNLIKKSMANTHKAVLIWCSILLKIGESGVDVDNYAQIFNQEVETLYLDLITDIESIYDKFMDKIDGLLTQINSLCVDLGIPMPDIFYKDPSQMPLNEFKVLLTSKVEEYTKLTEDRRNKYRELTEKQKVICESLGRDYNLLPESPLPTDQQLEDLKMTIDNLEYEKLERESEFSQYKEEIEEIISELGYTPTLETEKKILSLGPNEYLISDSSMAELTQFRKKLLLKLNQAREEIIDLRHTLEDLWARLELDIAERNNFLELHPGNSLATLEAFQTEILRCEQLKKANIKVFIDKQRLELDELWRKCLCTIDERENFVFFYSDVYNEDLFELHEREIEKWKSYFQNNHEIFKNLEKYEKLWEKWMDLEFKPEGVDRYKNRGGKLLEEERLRRELKKKIPDTERRLLQLGDEFFQKNGFDFLAKGKTIQQFISELHDKKEKIFQQILSAKKQAREQPSVSSQARSRLGKTLFPPNTPSMVLKSTPSKRKVQHTPHTTELAKRSKTVITSTKKKTAASARLPSLNVSKNSKNKRLSRKRKGQKHRLMLSALSSTMSSNKENNEERQDVLDYSEFEKEVSTKKKCRSTAVGVPNGEPSSSTSTAPSCNIFRTPLAAKPPQRVPKIVIEYHK